jgi:hypothetical protein
MRGPLCLLAALLAIMLVPGSAAASNYCVGAVSVAECAGSYPATGAGLQSALDDADNNADIGGTPDTVQIGPGSYSAVHGFRTIGGDLSVVGSGPTTVLSSSGGTSSDTVLALKLGGAPAAAVRNLQVQLTGVRAEAIWDFREVADVHIGGPGTIYDKGIRLPSGGRITRVLIDAAHVSGISSVIVASSGVIEDSLIRVDAAPGLGYAFGILGDSVEPSGTSNLTLRNVSILGDGSAKSVGLITQGSRSEVGVNTESVHVRDSLIHGFEYALARQGQSGTPSGGCEPKCFEGLANIDIRYSSLALALALEAGPGATSTDQGNLSDPPPGLDLNGSPQAGSPLIDAGDPASPEPGDSATDLAGHARVLNGRRDIGAFELVPLPATPSPSPSPTGPANESPTQPPHVAPVISGLTLSHTRFRAGPARKRGTAIHFTISAPVTYTLRIDRVLGGHLHSSHGKPLCGLATRTRGQRCRLYRRQSTLTGVTRAGLVSVAFSGRIGSKRLRPGLYRLTVEARDATGASALARRVSFTILP